MTKNEQKDIDTLRALSSQDFLMLGMNQIAYIRPLAEGDGYALHGANGQQLVTQDTAAHVAQLALQNDLQPMTLH